MKKILNIISDIALGFGLICFFKFLYDLFTSGDLTFGIPTLILFGILGIIFILAKDKRNVFVDIWTFLEIIFDKF